MQETSKITIRSALCGFLIGMALYVYVSLFDYSKPRTALDEVIVPVSFVLCPPLLLLILCIDCDVEGLSGTFLFLLIGLMNAGLYSIIGFSILRIRKLSVWDR
ncbi:MAG TPA: hypothetical protein VHR84_20680 [Terriglobales bacterium]|jgi:hypothetical protein|nr:hypothetical protein [Terriglobales bacterium]